MLSPKTAEELHGLLERAIVTHSPHSPSALGPRVAAPPEFCKVWPQAKPILDGIGPLLGFIPGYGTVAAAALRGLLEVGQHVYDQSCGPKPVAATAVSASPPAPRVPAE